MIYIGVDPGSTGAVAYLDDRDPDDWSWRVYKLTGTDLPIGSSVPFGTEVWRAVEKVSASPVMSPSAAFTFGRNYQWALDTYKPNFNPTPQQWQKAWASNLAGKTQKARKDALWTLAKVYVPDVPKYAADAVLIAVWARITHLKNQ
jgi:hypothetical protein